MANAYYAVNRIVHGVGGGEEQVFEPGDKVSGLTKEEMVALWEAGVLEERDPNAVGPADARDDRIAQLEAELAAVQAEKAAAEAAASESEGPVAEEVPEEVPEEPTDDNK